MVEQWSSKPYAWVRFLLPLTHMNLNRLNNFSHSSAPSYFNVRKHKKKFIELKKLILIKNSTIPRPNIYFRLNNVTPIATPTNIIFKKFRFLKLTQQNNFNFWYSRIRIFSNTSLLQSEFFKAHHQPSFVRWADMATRSEIVNVTQKVLQNSLLAFSSFPQVLTQLFKNSYIESCNYAPDVSEYYGKLQNKKTQKLITWAQKRFKLLQRNFSQHKRLVKSATRPVTLPVPQPHVLWKHQNTVTLAALNSVNAKMNSCFTEIHHNTNAMKLLSQYLKVNNSIQVFNETALFSPTKIYTNLLPCHQLRFQKTFKNFHNRSKAQFHPAFLIWYNFLITRFLENFTGHQTCIIFNPCLAKSLTFQEKAQLLLWTQRIGGFQRMIGPKVSLLESLEITYLSLKLKEPTLLSNWLIRTIRKVSFWKYKAFFRFLKFLFNNLLLLIFKSLSVLGIKIKLKGKISVAGNARTRTIYYRVGSTSHAKIQNKILHNLNLVHTFTGVLGLQIWYYF